MAAPNLPKNLSIMVLRECISEVLTALELDPLAIELASPFRLLLKKWLLVLNGWLGVLDSVTRARRKVRRVDESLDSHIDDFVLEAKKYPDVYVYFFADHPPSLLKRSILGEALEQARWWIDALAKQKIVALQAFGETFAGDVQAADKAIEELRDAESKRDTFRDFGPMAELLTEFVRERDNAYAQLEAVRADKPELRLPRDWAATFFRVTQTEPEPTDEVRKAKAEARERRRKEKLEQQEKVRAAREELREAKRKLREVSKNKVK